ncbi:hypothetical protein P3W45_001243 [Vairimorpha bombi]|jgi:hypothetical protein
MRDDFHFLLNKRLSRIIDKYKDVDDSLDLSIDILTEAVYEYPVIQDEIKEEKIKEHIKEFNRIYSLKFEVSCFNDLYDLLFFGNI